MFSFITLPALLLAAAAGPAEPPGLRGTWMAVELDGARPALGHEPQLSFGRTEYSGGTGCNAIQGRYSIRGGRLIMPHVVQTEIACGPPLSTQERRMIALLEGGPRIVRLDGRQIALVDRRGRMRLVRASARPNPALR